MNFSLALVISLIFISSTLIDALILKRIISGKTQLPKSSGGTCHKQIDIPFQHRNTMALDGIPKLFRWLVDLYPIVLESVTNRPAVASSSKAGQDNMAIDNFYLDMNGIIHACTHSNSDKLIALNERDMFQRIFSYTDRLYKLIKPSKLMFLAVDGVAPRAKMNQQRSRRFRSSKEREVLLADYVAREGKLPEEESFDSNCITPGTEFMFRLGIAFQKWISYKMETDSFWQSGAEIVFSGPDVPGEGEHKVMDMIRFIRSDPSYELGTLRHCMYGLDADLIMLSLVTHEPYFVLLREKISKKKQNKDAMSFTPEDFELLEISILRQMLKQHFRKLQFILDQDGKDRNINEPGQSADSTMSAPKGRFDIERIIDDFVFTCFLIGNDFLPSIPHLDISDGSLNMMMNIYRDIMPRTGGYLSDKNGIHLPRLELYIQELARREPLYFQQRAVDEKEPNYADDGYKNFYYKTKFGIEPGDNESIRKIVTAYVQGLAWVATYYHHGCGSWTWYYPYLYAPLASDLVNLGELKLDFEQGVPFTPLLQLLSVLPPQSCKFLPPSYEEKMVSSNSPLKEYYPKDFEVDANGKRNSWECIVCIPFINEKLLVDVISSIDHDKELTEVEKQRNRLGKEHRFKPPKQRKDQNEVDEKSMTQQNKGGKWGNAFVDEWRR